MKLHFVPEGPAVQINLLLLLEFILPLLSQSEACYDLTQPCKSSGIGLPEDKRSLSFSKLWLDQHFAKSDDRQRGQAWVCAWGAQAPGINPGSGCLREMPRTWTFVPGGENTGARNDPLHTEYQQLMHLNFSGETTSHQGLHRTPGVFPKSPSMVTCCPNNVKYLKVPPSSRNKEEGQGIRRRAGKERLCDFQIWKSWCREQQKHKMSSLDEFQQNSSFPSWEEGVRHFSQGNDPRRVPQPHKPGCHRVMVKGKGAVQRGDKLKGSFLLVLPAFISESLGGRANGAMDNSWESLGQICEFISRLDVTTASLVTEFHPVPMTSLFHPCWAGGRHSGHTWRGWGWNQCYFVPLQKVCNRGGWNTRLWILPKPAEKWPPLDTTPSHSGHLIPQRD